jgi:rfaE bifunctional protein nucleotidyltransferase chain/domain
MNHPKIVSLKEILYNVSSDPIVFTNGCFDMFHAGHAHMLKSIKRSAPLDAKLVVGINSDESVRANKGPDRPIICEEQRAYLVACHESVDSVFIFNEVTVERHLRRLKPAFWYKGGDYDISNLNLSEKDASKNTEILFMPFLEGISATKIINNIKNK